MDPQKGFEISPYAILAALLFHINETEEIEVKMDDASPPKKVTVKTVGIQKEEDAALCILPMATIMKFATIPYDFKFKVEDGHAVLFFEKQFNKTAIYSANGQKVVSASPALDRLMERMK